MFIIKVWQFGIHKGNDWNNDENCFQLGIVVRRYNIEVVPLCIFRGVLGNVKKKNNSRTMCQISWRRFINTK